MRTPSADQNCPNCPPLRSPGLNYCVSMSVNGIPAMNLAGAFALRLIRSDFPIRRWSLKILLFAPSCHSKKNCRAAASLFFTWLVQTNFALLRPVTCPSSPGSPVTWRLAPSAHLAVESGIEIWPFHRLLFSYTRHGDTL